MKSCDLVARRTLPDPHVAVLVRAHHTAVVRCERQAPYDAGVTGVDRPGVGQRTGRLERLRSFPALRIGRAACLDAPDRDPGGHAGHDRERERCESQPHARPPAPLGLVELALVEVPSPPVQHGRGQHIVIDLVGVLSDGA